jgi:hypothetical protein
VEQFGSSIARIELQQFEHEFDELSEPRGTLPERAAILGRRVVEQRVPLRPLEQIVHADRLVRERVHE